MINIIKADGKRILKSKSIFGVPLFILVFSLIVTALFAGLKSLMELDLETFLGESAGAISTIGAIVTNGPEMTLFLMQSDTLIYVFVFILLSVSAFDFSSGTIKNMLSIGKSKAQIYFAKLCTSYVWTILCVVFYALTAALCGHLFFQDVPTSEDVLKLISITLKHIPVYLSIITIGHLFVFTTQKIASSMLLYIGCTMLFETIIPLADMVIDLPFKIAWTMPIYQLVELSQNNVSWATYLTAYIACSIYIIGGSIGGYYLFKRSELK